MELTEVDRKLAKSKLKLEKYERALVHLSNKMLQLPKFNEVTHKWNQLKAENEVIEEMKKEVELRQILIQDKQEHLSALQQEEKLHDLKQLISQQK